PLLLGTGYHVRHDIPAALAAAPQVSARVAAALGPDPRLADILLDRLAEVGALRPQPVDKKVETGGIVDNPVCDAIVLAAAGSTDASANADTARMAELLAELTGRTVVPSYLCAGPPTPRDAVDALRASGADHVALAGYLLGPGHFARKAAAAGATTATAPLGAHPDLARLVLERYDAAVASFDPRPALVDAEGARASI
ncbi:MAG: sirohydrochlorin chelatase, partial [Streptomycetaceae bacterium]|nr:sirohydrochlorin chelatase [Streptomycetaceae bacterium]